MVINISEAQFNKLFQKIRHSLQLTNGFFFDVNENLMKSIDTNDIKHTRKITGL